jgi:signal transduction histidine kinase
MRTLTHVATILAAVAGILALSVASALRDERRLLDDFAAENRERLRAAAEVLGGRLDALDRDTRMLVDVVEHSQGGRQLEPATQRQVLAGALQALAKVVDQYRSIALYREDASLDVMGLDPHEDEATGDALLELSRQFAPAVTQANATTLGKPALWHGGRAFFLYGAPVRGGRSLVVVSDVSIFLAPLTASLPASARLYVTDPAGTVWSGCGSASGCHQVAAAAMGGGVEHSARTGHSLGLSGAGELRIVAPVERPGGIWSLTWIASTQAIVNRERWLMLRLVLGVVAAAGAVAGVGLVILRQQRKAFALESHLQMAQTLAGARATSEAIVENAPLGVLGLSQDGRVVLANRFLSDRLGPATLGLPLREAFSGDGALLVRELEPMLLDERESAGDTYRSLRPVSASAPPFDVRIAPVREPALGVHTFALFEDRSKIRELEQQLVRAEKLITVGVLSAGIAHEIGSPLAVIRGRAEQVLRDVSTGPRAEDLRVIIKHIDNIASTIRQLLDFSRRQAIERRAVPLEAVVKRARELLQWKVDAKHLRLETALRPDLPALAADPDQLQQVLVNLLLNAADASEREGLVRVAAHVEDQSGAEPLVAIEITDQGCGIAPEHMHAVFDPFFTTKKRGEGTGLGLSIALGIVRNHGGKIDLASTHAKGTTVTVLWPAISAKGTPRA